MRASIVTTVLDSHEIIRRQILYLNSVMPSEVEWVLVDDGSNPPIQPDGNEFPLILHRTNNFKPWTEKAARVEGVKRTTSGRLICVDIDHVLTKDLILFVANTDYDFIKFRREFATLDEDGRLQQDRDVLIQYGMRPGRIRRYGVRSYPPGNCYGMSRSLFLRLIGERERVAKARRLKYYIKWLAKSKQATMCKTEERPMIYAIPNGKFCRGRNDNPFGLFHGLERDEDYLASEKIRI
jgi:hypothetical protein